MSRDAASKRRRNTQRAQRPEHARARARPRPPPSRRVLNSQVITRIHCAPRAHYIMAAPARRVPALASASVVSPHFGEEGLLLLGRLAADLGHLVVDLCLQVRERAVRTIALHCSRRPLLSPPVLSTPAGPERTRGPFVRHW